MPGNVSVPFWQWEAPLRDEYLELNQGRGFRRVHEHLVDAAAQAADSGDHFEEAHVIAALSTIERFFGKKREAYETACKAVCVAAASRNQSVLFALCHPFLFGCAGEMMGQYEDTEGVIAEAAAALGPPYDTCIRRILQAEAHQDRGGVALYEQAILAASPAVFLQPRDGRRLRARALVGLGRALCGVSDWEGRRWGEDVQDLDRGLGCLKEAVELLGELCSPDDVALHEPSLRGDLCLANRARLYLGQALQKAGKLVEAKEQLVKLCDDVRDDNLLSEDLMQEEDLLAFHLLPSSSNYVSRSAVCSLLQVLLALGTEADKEMALWVSEMSRARAFRTKWYDKRQSSWLPSWTLGADLHPFGNVLDVVQVDSATLLYYACLDVSGTLMAVWVVSQEGYLLDCRQIHVAQNNVEFKDWASVVAGTRGIIQEREQTRHDVECGGDAGDPRGLIEGLPGISRIKKGHQRLEDLYDLLIRPIEGCLADHVDLVIVPDGPLHLLPFQALRRRETEQYLFQRHTVRVNPSLAVWRCCLETRPQEGRIGKSATAIAINSYEHCGNWRNGKPLESLKEAEREGKGLKDEYGESACTVLIGADATVDAVVKAMEEEEAVLHFALHGLLDMKALALHDGLLTADRIANMRLKAHLVVLSACDSGRGEYGADGVYSLARAFALAGVPCILMTLWPMVDSVACKLMHRFHAFLRDTRRADQALGRALADVLTLPAVDRFHWAAVTVMGTCASERETIPGIKACMTRAKQTCDARGWPWGGKASWAEAKAYAERSGVPPPDPCEFFFAVGQGMQEPAVAYVQACRDAANRGDRHPTWAEFLLGQRQPPRDTSKYRVRLVSMERERGFNRLGRFVPIPEAGAQSSPPNRYSLESDAGRRYQFV